MTAVDDDGAFQETFLLSIAQDGGSDISFAAVSEELTPEEGDKDGEGIAMGNGGRIWKRTPEGDYEITIKIYPIDLEVGNASDLAQFFMGDVSDTSAPISVTNLRTRLLFRVSALFTDDPDETTAHGATTTAFNARRITFQNARCTSYKESWDDKILSAEVTFKGPAFSLAGTGLIKRESVLSGDSAQVLPALGSYTAIA